MSDEALSRRRRNFMFVASRSSSNHLAYTRDLVMLITISMEIGATDLVFDLAAEVLDSPEYKSNSSAFSLVVSYLRDIGKQILDAIGLNADSARPLKRLLRLFRKV